MASKPIREAVARELWKIVWPEFSLSHWYEADDRAWFLKKADRIIKIVAGGKK